MSPWAEPRGDARLGPARRGPSRIDAVQRLKDWTRERFALAEADTVLVTEGRTALPGFPECETLVTFWTEGGSPHHFRVFKPLEAVSPEDLPPAWMREALGGTPGVSCACC